MSAIGRIQTCLLPTQSGHFSKRETNNLNIEDDHMTTIDNLYPRGMKDNEKVMSVLCMGIGFGMIINGFTDQIMTDMTSWIHWLGGGIVALSGIIIEEK